MPIVLRKQKGESKDDLLNRFRKITIDEGIADEVKKRTEFVKKSRRRYEREKELKKIKRRPRG